MIMNIFINFYTGVLCGLLLCGIQFMHLLKKRRAARKEWDSKVATLRLWQALCRPDINVESNDDDHEKIDT